MNRLLVYVLLALSFTVQAAIAQQLPIVAQDLVPENLLKNAGFESGAAGWVASGGATKTADATAKAFGNYGYDWDSNSAAQTLVSTSVTVPNGLKGKLGVAFCSIQAASGTPTHTITVNDGTNDLVTAATISTGTTSFTKNLVYFTWPTSGSVRIKFASVASNEPAIYIDSCYLGDAFTISAVSNTDWSDISSSVSFSGLGTTSGTKVRARTEGDILHVVGYVVSGTHAASALSIDFTGYTFKFSPTTFAASTERVGHATMMRSSALAYDGDNGLLVAFIDGSDTNSVFVSYASTSSVFAKANGNSLGDTGAGFSFELRIPIVSSSSQAVRLDTVNWRVDANISGSNIDLATTDQASYTGLTDSGLTLTNNTGNGVLTAQIPCGVTTSPSGTTCSGNPESIGVSWVQPAAGDVMVCASFSHSVTNSASSAALVTFQLVETPTNAQTISQEGKGRVASTNGTVSTAFSMPHRLCGTFTFASAGQKVVRLFYEQDVTNTPTTNMIIGDAAAATGQRDIHFEVYPINQQVPAPVLVGQDQMVFLKDVKASGTDAGTFTAGAWRTRDLNTLQNLGNYSWVTSPSSNQWTLTAGSYEVDAEAPAYAVFNHKAKLKNITDSTDQCLGSSEYATGTGPTGQTRSHINCSFTITGTKTFEIQHYSSNTNTSSGFGLSYSGAGVTELYTVVKIRKIIP